MPVKRKSTSKAKRVVKKTAVRKVAAKKKVVAKKKAIVKKTTVKKKVAAKKSVAKKKVVARKKVVVKKTTVKKKVAANSVLKQKATGERLIKKPTVKKMTQNKNTDKKITMSKIVEPAPIMNSKSVAEKIEEKKAAPMIIEKEHLRQSVTGPVPSIPPYKAMLGEEYMNEQQLQHFMKVLIAWKCDLMQGVDKTVGHLKEDAENYADLTDRATQEEEFSLELRTRDRERKLLKKIETAVQRINDDDFGYCEACGVEIGLPRLEVRPTATLCIDCKTVEEIREKQIML